jgi:hypothetical protein
MELRLFLSLKRRRGEDVAAFVFFQDSFDNIYQYCILRLAKDEVVGWWRNALGLLRAFSNAR